MTDLSPLISPGRADGAGDFDALFLRKFSGEVITSYTAELKLLPRIRMKTLKGGKNYTFPATGEATARLHLRGERAIDNLSDMEFGERLVKLDRPIVSEQFVDEWEEMVNHFDVRGPITEQMGQAVAQLAEQHAMRALFRGSEVATDVAGQALGNQQIVANVATSAADALGAIEAQILDWNQKNVPMGGRFCVVTPEVWNLLVDLTDFQSVDLGNGGNGSIRTNMVGMIKGVEIIMTTVMPQTDFTTAPGLSDGTNGYANDYRGDMEFCEMLFGTKRAIGGVTLKGLQIYAKKEELDGGSYFKSSKTCGFSVLRESDCGSVITEAD